MVIPEHATGAFELDSKECTRFNCFGSTETYISGHFFDAVMGDYIFGDSCKNIIFPYWVEGSFEVSKPAEVPAQIDDRRIEEIIKTLKLRKINEYQLFNGINLLKCSRIYQIDKDVAAFVDNNEKSFDRRVWVYNKSGSTGSIALSDNYILAVLPYARVFDSELDTSKSTGISIREYAGDSNLKDSEEFVFYTHSDWFKQYFTII